MTDDDFLARFSTALAEETDGASAAPGATRARILTALQGGRRKRRLRLLWGGPLLVFCAGGTAWAGVEGWLPLPEWLGGTASTEVATSLPPAPKAPVAQGSGRSPDGDEAGADSAVVEPDVPELLEPRSFVPGKAPPLAPALDGKAPDVAGVVPSRSGSAAPSSAPPARSAETSPSVPSAAVPRSADEEDDGALGLYRSAHESHFRGGDCRGALDGYARYLERAPAGPFATDARYNSAICAIRLGRTEDARRHLRTVVRSSESYRREDARTLLDALEGRSANDE